MSAGIRSCGSSKGCLGQGSREPQGWPGEQKGAHPSGRSTLRSVQPICSLRYPCKHTVCILPTGPPKSHPPPPFQPSPVLSALPAEPFPVQLPPADPRRPFLLSGPSSCSLMICCPLCCVGGTCGHPCRVCHTVQDSPVLTSSHRDMRCGPSKDSSLQHPEVTGARLSRPPHSRSHTTQDPWWGKHLYCRSSTDFLPTCDRPSVRQACRRLHLPEEGQSEP